MSVKDFYAAIEGNYDEVFANLGDDEVISDFVKKFLNKNEMDLLKKLLLKKKYNEAFICVHNMKGYGLNMAIPILHKTACDLCEALRNGAPSVNIKPLVADLEVAYERIKEASLKL